MGCTQSVVDAMLSRTGEVEKTEDRSCTSSRDRIGPRSTTTGHAGPAVYRVPYVYNCRTTAGTSPLS
jgi:hypothetical protein